MFRFFICLTISLSVPTLSVAQTKVEVGVTQNVQKSEWTRVIIVTRPDPSAAAGGLSLSNPSVYVKQVLGVAASEVRPIGGLPIVSAEVSVAALEKLNSDPNVALVTRDTPQPATLMDSVPEIGADKVHNLGYEGTDYAVAVLDTGVQFDHPALVGSIIAEACFSTVHSSEYQVHSLCTNDLDMSILPGAARGCPAEINGCQHGTHVTGIIAGHTMHWMGQQFEGVAPGAKIVSVQVFTLFEDTNACAGAPRCVLSFVSDQLRALEWVYKKVDELKIAAVNMSLGGGYHNSACDKTNALTEIIERLKAKRVATVAAAGNDKFYDGLAEPACISSVISVAAEDKAGKLDVSYSNVSTLVHVATPGTNIVSSIPGSGYLALTGTSMAAPHVSAAIAVLRSKYPLISVDDLEKKIIGGAPILVDQRTGTKVPALELSHTTIAVSTPASPGQSEQPLSTPPSNITPPTSNSFIIKGETIDKINHVLSQVCEGQTCSVRQIAPDALLVDISPKGKATSDSIKPITKESLEKSLDKGLGRVINYGCVLDARDFD